jgi:hypothetical protein
MRNCQKKELQVCSSTQEAFGYFRQPECQSENNAALDLEISQRENRL